MIGVADLEKVVALALTSAYVEGEKPLSLMIVSDRPESGKTAVVSQYGNNNGIALLSDATAFALWRDYGKRIARGEIKHIIVPEFLAPLSRNSGTVGSLIATFQMMIEEGLKAQHSGAMKEALVFSEPKVVGVICCLPGIAYARNKLSWTISGFLSRFIVITYKYAYETVDSIFESILSQEYMNELKINLDFPENKVKVAIPQDVGRKCLALANGITAQARETHKLYGFRELKNILRVISANVVLENMQNKGNRKAATLDDFKEVERLSYLFNEQFNEVKK